MKKTFKETSKTGAAAWLLQRISAVILFVLLIIHFVTYHFIARGVYPWEEVVAKMQSPWFNLMQFIFLVTALFHGLNGVWMVTEDYIHGRTLRMIVYGLILLVGLALFFIGTVTIIKISGLDLTKFAEGV